MTFPPILRALNSRNYRLFFTGQCVSLIGNWMTNTATVWLAYEISRSAFIAGLLAFASQIPLLVLAPVGGLIGDRGDKRTLLARIQIVCAIISVSMAVAVFTGHATVAMLVAVASIRGLINAAEFPTRQSFIVDLVDDKEDLSNAIALNSTMFNIARLIGPSVAGAIIVVSGPAWCFVLDALSFIVAMTSLLAIRPPQRPKRPEKKHFLEELRDGLNYARSHPLLRAPLTIVPLISFSGFAGTVLAPVFAKELFQGDARALGLLLSAMGVGALCSALYLGSRTSSQGLEKWIAAGALLTALSQGGFSLGHSLGAACLCLVLNGAGVVLVLAGSNTLIQSLVEDSMRGRVMGIFVMGQGLYPLGSLVIGAVASGFGPRMAVAFCSVLSLSATLLFFRMINKKQAELGSD